MGILDDAIREHLELKRQHGAQDDDLERLEKEAFGAPARPGDPEFGEEPEAAAAVGAPPEEAPPSTEGGTQDWLASEEETTVAPQAPASDSPAEQARAEHAHLGDTADHPAPEEADEPTSATVEPAPPAEPEPAAEASEPAAEVPPAGEAPVAEPLPPGDEPEAEESEPPEAPERAIFDADEFDFDEMDLELEEEDDGTVGPQPASDEPLPPESASGSTPPAFVEDDTDNPPLPVQRPGEEAPESAEGEGDDLLEETPDFLQDAPEGEDLWFEQGPPKDFDFDDD